VSTTQSQLTPDEPGLVRAGEELPLAKLKDFIHAHAPEVGTINHVNQFPSGFSNLTYGLQTNRGEFILRRPPFGANIKSAHDMGREFQVLTLLKPHYSRIPQPMVLCQDESVVGAPFYVMTRLSGVILRAHHTNVNLAPSTLRTLSENLVDNLVQLHSIDIIKSGLVALGKPDGYVQRQVAGWIARYEKAATDAIGDMNAVAEWLPKNLPLTQAPGFLHNDYKYDNVVLDTHNLTNIIGVLDWEMATVGDPLMDVGAALAYWCEPTDAPITRLFNLTWLPGNLSRQEFIDRYARKSGRDVSRISFYYAFGLFKNAVIAQQIYARWKAGHTRDPRFGQLIHAVKSLAKQAAEAIEKN
jgi:aminoglycoside phosphotransferase (APT) family kinase protein